MFVFTSLSFLVVLGAALGDGIQQVYQPFKKSVLSSPAVSIASTALGTKDSATESLLSTSVCTAADDLTFHGGSVMHGPIGLYNIFLGQTSADYSSSTTPSIIGNYAAGLNNSEYANILTYLYDKKGHISNQYVYRGQAFINLNLANLTDTVVLNQVILSAINTNSWVPDTHSLFTVFFSGAFSYYSATTKGSWLKDWCGFHSGFTLSGDSNIYAWATVGDPTQVPLASKPNCAPIFYGYAGATNFTGASPVCTNRSCSLVSPNNNAPADAMVSTFAHEINEAVSDTYNGWYRDCDGYENGDLCAYDYGLMRTDGVRNFNLQLNNKSFIVQQNWRIKSYNYNKSACALSALPYISSASRSQLPVLLTIGITGLVALFTSAAAN